MTVQSYKDLNIYKMAHKLAVEIHETTTSKLPAIEKFEEGSQIRRSSKSVVCNIVEGFGLRNYKKDFIRYLIQALASIDETKGHLRWLTETGSLEDKTLFQYFFNQYEELGRKTHAFIKGVQREHVPRL